MPRYEAIPAVSCTDLLLILSCDEHQAFAKQQRRRKHGTENLAVPLALNRIFFFSKGDAGVEPHPGSIDCV